MMKRRTLLAASLAAPAVARADVAAWPTKTVRFICPFAPGGGTDTVSRLICDQLARRFGQQFVVDNKSGAGGNIGMAELARAAPDGYTLGLITVASHTLNPMLYTKLPYDADKDVVGISRLAILSNLLGVTPSLPANSVAELIALCKASPGKYSFASSGPGSSLHLSGELFKVMAGVDILHILQGRRSGLQRSDVRHDHHDVRQHAVDAAAGAQRPGQGVGRDLARALMGGARAASHRRDPAGLRRDVVVRRRRAARTPEPILARLETAIIEALAEPDIRKRWETDLGLDMPPVGRKGFDAFLAEDRRLWTPAVKASGVRLD